MSRFFKQLGLTVASGLLAATLVGCGSMPPPPTGAPGTGGTEKGGVEKGGVEKGGVEKGGMEPAPK